MTVEIKSAIRKNRALRVKGRAVRRTKRERILEKSRRRRVFNAITTRLREGYKREEGKKNYASRHGSSGKAIGIRNERQEC